MVKFLAVVHLVIEAEDWNDAFDFLDELTKNSKRELKRAGMA